MTVRDSFGRAISYARLSVTDRCNFRCVYCMPRKGVAPLPHSEIVTFEELLRFCCVAACLGIDRFRITGGEPLCRKGCVDFMRELKRLPHVEQVCLTTNGSFLSPHLEALATLGLDGLNVSLDTLSQARFAAISRSGLPIAGIVDSLRRAAALGIVVKINVVPMKGINDDGLVDSARFALENGFHIRFIELMPVGRARKYAGVSQRDVFDRLCRAFGRLTEVSERNFGNGPAVNYAVPGFDARIGFISALSHKFCHKCNRVRLTSSGFLKSCLHHNTGIDLKTPLRGGATDAELAEALVSAVRAKPAQHEFGSAGGGFFMSSVGG
ncbi:MAG: molybdenum cofactor biosynthesis protein MoaA [Candidatus Desulfovibrio kirbyi]|uniref:GTP 3',8-cyclase n=1 Tax=Candidatus Desulfovibrio kirbyi TaxID=2696086 RepID=A0A6L2R467_9BACT|nr:MAG: molybdenum cofactor biosynthesis protein MoaA [Candidatus Desulfovibrio kirbyi]